MKEDKEYVIPLDEEKLKNLGNNIEKYIGYKCQYELLQERINKAIEYIKWQQDNPQYDNEWRKYECESLIKILKGEDK